MKEFENIQKLKAQFTKGEIRPLPDTLSVEGIIYDRLTSTSYKFDDIISGAKKAMVIYHLDTNKDNIKKYKEKKHDKVDEPKSFQDRLVFVWAAIRNSISPAEVKFIPKQRINLAIVREADQNQNIIGDVVEVRFTTISQSVSIKGKVDTGALMSSLHADKTDINEKTNTVSFISKSLSTNVITLPLQDKQAIKSADGGTEYRPVIALNIEINGKRLQDVLFNLNNRSNMDHQLLVGQNILEKGKFLIDPTIQENENIIDWDKLQEEFKDIIIEDKQPDIEDIFKIMAEGNFSFSDIIKYIKTESHTLK